MTTPLNFTKRPRRIFRSTCSSLLAAAITVAGSGCTAGSKAVTFDPSKTCGVTFSRPRSCPNEHDVTVEVDGTIVAVPDRTSTIVVTVHQGYHTFIQYVDRYEVRRWKNEPIVNDDFYTLECFGQSDPREPRQPSKQPR